MHDLQIPLWIPHRGSNSVLNDEKSLQEWDLFLPTATIPQNSFVLLREEKIVTFSWDCSSIFSHERCCKYTRQFVER